jgi:NitT/TauT family transport system ATP-binding protein
MNRAKTNDVSSGRGAIQLRELSVSFGSLQAVRDISLNVAPGEFISVLGPSGCGKSTLIGAIAGFAAASRGTALVDGEPTLKPGVDRGVVFQQPTLFPWKTVLENAAFGLKMRGTSRIERLRAAREILEQVGLQDFLHHFPSQLSGGMQQRVSLARVLVNRPRVMLLDEPFSALDAQTRLQMQELLLDLWSKHRLTVIFVTHDIDEAIFLSNRIVVLSHRPGTIKAEFTVPLARPRLAEVLVSDEFTQIKRRCFDLLREDTATPFPSFLKTDLPKEPADPVVATAGTATPWLAGAGEKR